MSRSWQDIFQKGQGFSNQAIDQLSGIEVDLATALSGGAAAAPIVFSHSGDAATWSGTLRYPIPLPAMIHGVFFTAGTAPTGASLIIDVNKNGTTIFTTQANRPTIAAGSNQTSQAFVPDITSVSTNDYLTVDIDQIGSTVSGSDLVVLITFA